MPVPYYPAPDPIIPDAQRNIAPEIILKGVASLADMANARDRIQIESEKMILDAALTTRGQDIARENNRQDYEVGLKNAEAYSEYRKTLAGFENDPTNPLSKAWRANKARLTEQDFADFMKELDTKGLLATKPENPVEFYRNAKEVEKNWMSSTDPRIRNVLKSINETMEAYHTVPLREGFTQNKEGKWVAAGDVKQVPIGRLIEQLNDPAQLDATMQLLERNGLATTVTKNAPQSFAKSDYVRDYLFGKKPVETTRTIAPSFGKYMEMGKGIDFGKRSPTRLPRTVEPIESDLPTGVTQDDVDQAAAASEEAPLPAPEGTFAPTKADKLKQSYLSHVNEPGFDKEAAKQFLVQNGVDISDLP